MKPELNGFDLRILPPRAQWEENEETYEAQLTAIQRLRGAVYLQDGAIPIEALDAEGRHRSEWDERSYHICAWASTETLAGCFRLIMHSEARSLDALCMAPALDRMTDTLKGRVMSALDKLLNQAREESLNFGELGGWAVDAKFRRNRDLWLMPLITYSLHEHLGSVIGVIHATHRHRSVEILKQLGATPLMDDEAPLPSYFDAFYDCNMEFICFDSRKPPERFKPVIATFLAAIKQGHRRIDKAVLEKQLAG